MYYETVAIPKSAYGISTNDGCPKIVAIPVLGKLERSDVTYLNVDAGANVENERLGSLELHLSKQRSVNI